ncbi:hypothetical protein QU814_20150 [Providencia rettgeri]|nr:hypothetical protein [Providencia rettgeri]MDM9285426.1 hypothetical protein [Providencia rettgeri]MDN0021301.1 hypothetical protein [Providencia stuartii]
MEIKRENFDSVFDINKWLKNNKDVKIINIETRKGNITDFTNSYTVWFYVGSYWGFIFMIKLSKGSKNYYLTRENGQLVFIKNIKVRNKNDVKDGNKTAKKQVYKIIVGIDLLPDEADRSILKSMLEQWKSEYEWIKTIKR